MSSINSLGKQPPLPVSVGIGLRAVHHLEILSQKPAIGWLEVHSENYFADGGPHVRCLEQLRQDYPLSLHGVGLSLGSADELSRVHLERLRRTVRRFEPNLVSDHLAWISYGGQFVNDLMPLPYTEEACRVVSRRIRQVQNELGRQILIENLSSYVAFEASDLPESVFLASVVAESGCGILLDVNNVHVSAHNLGFDAGEYLRGVPVQAVREIHLAGYTERNLGVRTVLIDSHAARVSAPVWALYEQALARFGPVPTLVEWDSDLPALPVLLEEADTAQRYLDRAYAVAA